MLILSILIYFLLSDVIKIYGVNNAVNYGFEKDGFQKDE